MSTATFKFAEPAQSFYSAFKVDVDSEVNDNLHVVTHTFNFQRSVDDLFFQDYLRDLCSDKDVTHMATREGLKLISDCPHKLSWVFDTLLREVQSDFDNYEKPPMPFWKFRLVTATGDTIYFIGKEEDEPAWIADNLKLLKRAELKRQ